MLLEFVLRLKGYPLEKARRALFKIQELSPGDFNIWQDKKRWEIARYHFDNNKAYRALFTSGFPGNWESLPIVQKKHLQGDFSCLISRPFLPATVHCGSTSGSSGHPFFYAKDKYAHAMTYALIEDRYAWHGLSIRQKQARFYGIPIAGWSRWVEQVKDMLGNRIRFPVFDLSDETLRVFLQTFFKKKIRYLYGYTSALVLFARFLEREQCTLKDVCPSLNACIVTAEVCVDGDKAILEKAFGVPVVNEYGASELGILAFSDADGDWILSKEDTFIEILDEQGNALPNGQTGRIVVTALHNRAFPLVRYEIGDIGAIDINTKNRLLRLSGRTNDIIVLPSGRKVAGLTFYYISRQLLESSGKLREFIVRQTALDTFTFDVVSDSPLSATEKARLADVTKTYLEDGLKILVQQVEKIDRPKSGKLKHFYSEL